MYSWLSGANQFRWSLFILTEIKKENIIITNAYSTKQMWCDVVGIFRLITAQPFLWLIRSICECNFQKNSYPRRAAAPLSLYIFLYSYKNRLVSASSRQPFNFNQLICSFHLCAISILKTLRCRAAVDSSQTWSTQ